MSTDVQRAWETRPETAGRIYVKAARGLDYGTVYKLLIAVNDGPRRLVDRPRHPGQGQEVGHGDLHRRHKSGKANSEINVTPLVDVVLVLLIIFLVTMPIMMKQVTLEVPRKADEQVEDVSHMGDQITILVKPDMSIVVNDGHKDTTIQAIDLAQTLRPLLDAKKVSEKLVFVDYCNSVAWGDVVSTMDSIRSIATDRNHDDDQGRAQDAQEERRDRQRHGRRARLPADDVPAVAQGRAGWRGRPAPCGGPAGGGDRGRRAGTGRGRGPGRGRLFGATVGGLRRGLRTGRGAG